MTAFIIFCKSIPATQTFGRDIKTVEHNVITFYSTLKEFHFNIENLQEHLAALQIVPPVYNTCKSVIYIFFFSFADMKTFYKNKYSMHVRLVANLSSTPKNSQNRIFTSSSTYNRGLYLFQLGIKLLYLLSRPTDHIRQVCY